MKNTRLFFFVTAILIAGIISARAQTADEIIQKHIVAIGGADNWKKITSIKKTCVRSSRGVEIPFTETILQGKGYKNENTFNGMTSYYIYTDKAGWRYNPSRGQQKPEPLPEELVKQAQTLLDIRGPLIDYKDKGNKITFYGTDDVEGTECYKLKIIFPTGNEVTYFIDVSDYSLVRGVSKTKANGKEQVSTATYGNYQKLPEGIVIPMSIDNVTIKSVEINKPVDENIFRPMENKQ